MACHGNHGVALVDVTLFDVSSRVGVNVRKYLETMLPAMFPKGGVPEGMEGDCPSLTGVGIEVVIAYECADAALFLQPKTQEEGAALATTGTSVTQLSN